MSGAANACHAAWRQAVYVQLTAAPDVIQVEGGSLDAAAQSSAAEAAAEGDGASPSGDDLRHGRTHQVGLELGFS